MVKSTKEPMCLIYLKSKIDDVETDFLPSVAIVDVSKTAMVKLKLRGHVAFSYSHRAMASANCTLIYTIEIIVCEKSTQIRLTVLSMLPMMADISLLAHIAAFIPNIRFILNSVAYGTWHAWLRHIYQGQNYSKVYNLLWQFLIKHAEINTVTLLNHYIYT